MIHAKRRAGRDVESRHRVVVVVVVVARSLRKRASREVARRRIAKRNETRLRALREAGGDDGR